MHVHTTCRLKAGSFLLSVASIGQLQIVLVGRLVVQTSEPIGSFPSTVQKDDEQHQRDDEDDCQTQQPEDPIRDVVKDTGKEGWGKKVVLLKLSCRC